MGYTVNISGEHANEIKARTQYNAYDANNVTAIETGKRTRTEARLTVMTIIKALQLTSKILYIFE